MLKRIDKTIDKQHEVESQGTFYSKEKPIETDDIYGCEDVLELLEMAEKSDDDELPDILKGEDLAEDIIEEEGIEDEVTENSEIETEEDSSKSQPMFFETEAEVEELELLKEEREAGFFNYEIIFNNGSVDYIKCRFENLLDKARAVGLNKGFSTFRFKNEKGELSATFPCDKTARYEDRSSWIVYQGGWEHGGFSIGPDGILFGKMNKKGNMIPKKLGTRGIIPIAEYDIPEAEKGSDISKTYYRLKWATAKEDIYGDDKYITNTAIISSREFQGNAGEKNEVLLTYNTPVLTHRKQEYIEIFDKLVKDQETRLKLIEERKPFLETGWHKNGEKWSFATPQHEDYINFGNAGEYLSKAGDAEIWKQTLKKLIEDNPTLALVHGFAVSGFFNNIIVDSNISPLMPLVGQRSQGKTTALGTVLSWVGGIERGQGRKTPYFSGDSTIPSLRDFLEKNNNMLAVVDELGARLEGMRPSDAQRFLTEILNNGGRAKYKTAPKNWCLSVFCSSNSSLVEKFSKGVEQDKALASRMIELKIGEDFEDREKFFEVRYDDLKDENGNRLSYEKCIGQYLRENYGHGIDILPKYIEENRDFLEKEIFGKWENYIVESLRSGFNVDGSTINLDLKANPELTTRFATIYASIMTGIFVVNDILGISEASREENVARANRIFASNIKKHEIAKVAEQGQQDILGLITTYAMHFKFKGYKYIEEGGEVEQKEAVKQHNNNVSNKMVWGRVVQKTIMESEGDFNCEVEIYKKGIDEIENKKILSDIDQLWNTANKQGWAVADKKNPTYKKNVNGTRIPVFYVNAKDILKEIENTEKTNNESQTEKTIYDMGFEPSY